MKNTNTEKLLNAIDNCDFYNGSQKKLLSLLLQISTDRVAKTNITKISDLLKQTRAAVYKSIKILEDDNAIKVTRHKQPRVIEFELKEDKLHDILTDYLKKEQYLKLQS